MSEEVISLFWKTYLENNGIPYTMKNIKSLRGLIQIKFIKEGYDFKLVINEEEYWFNMTSRTEFPTHKYYFEPDEDIFVARINGLVPMGVFSWDSCKTDDDKKFLLYRTYQNLVCEIKHIESMINYHYRHHDTYLREFVKSISSSEEPNLISEFSKLKNPF